MNKFKICSKCGEPIGERWESYACYINLEIGIDCCALDNLFGRYKKHAGFNHPAIQPGSDHQKLLIKMHHDSDYRLCWYCHREFVRMIGTFLDPYLSEANNEQD